VLDHVAEVDEPFLCHILTKAKAAIAVQTMLSAADGIAPCATPLMTKPIAPKRFIHWNKGDRPVTFPVVISK
jgi:hypothetical protein